MEIKEKLYMAKIPESRRKYIEELKRIIFELNKEEEKKKYSTKKGKLVGLDKDQVRETLNKDIEEFLNKGGKIQEIPTLEDKSGKIYKPVILNGDFTAFS
jgi:hypothetical protein